MKRIAAALAIIFSVFAVTVAVSAAADSPGSENDPLVTKSYVDSQIAKYGGNGSAPNEYTVVEVKAGQSVLGGEGTEIILRSGEASAIDNGANGVSDLTAGQDLITGQNVSLNHLLLVPRDDGRGIYALTDIFVMIRGPYSLQ
ncbi:MAG: hypothetical protein PHV71_00490 [Eubacteriales bacterium]|nr:hypothetical protein [Eubacteriales bacterium]MDD3198690.1 hypothetical protein [Eubacteriales bacterium]MDD4121698.1 hypothetical protein [Eubacteriales bacterium]MDD4629064.1 hypothetical protein [Eubacteriales bacterium]